MFIKETMQGGSTDSELARGLESIALVEIENVQDMALNGGIKVEQFGCMDRFWQR